MATTYKVLGQISSSANALLTLYTVPTTAAIVSSITVCNRGATDSSFRIAVSINNASISNEQYIYYNVPIGPVDTFIATVGLTLSLGDIVRVFSIGNNLSFQIFGSEIS